ncbi:MAG: hypothetical protein ACXWD8_18220 [Mycobacterium sp.]
MSERMRLPKVFVATALVLALVLGSWGAIPARVAQAASVSITYAAKTQATLTLCVGESDEIAVRVLRALTRPGRAVGLWVPGGRVLGFIGNGNIVHFEPSDGGRDVVGQPIPEAVFKVVADAPGQTEIEFVIHTTGEERSVGDGWPQADATVQVEVNDCYEAHTSALAKIFTDKDMGGLNKYFLLAGYTPNERGITTDTQVMFFMPNPQDRLRGGFAWVDLATTILGGLQGSCISYFSGRYEVVFYIPPNQPAPPGADVGDLMMYGQGDVFCSGRFTVHLDYRSSAGFQISFKPKPRP